MVFSKRLAGSMVKQKVDAKHKLFKKQVGVFEAEECFDICVGKVFLVSMFEAGVFLMSFMSHPELSDPQDNAIPHTTRV
jgi:hypothetical protein